MLAITSETSRRVGVEMWVDVARKTTSVAAGSEPDALARADAPGDEGRRRKAATVAIACPTTAAAISTSGAPINAPFSCASRRRTTEAISITPPVTATEVATTTARFVCCLAICPLLY